MALRKRRQALPPKNNKAEWLNGKRFNHKDNLSNDKGAYLIEIIDKVVEVSWERKGTKQSTTYLPDEVLLYLETKQWLLIP